MIIRESQERTRNRRKVHGPELPDLCCSTDIIWVKILRTMLWAEHVARMGEKINAYTIWVGKPEGKTPLERPRRRCEYNIKWDHK
jgi:hypothetical protein